MTEALRRRDPRPERPLERADLDADPAIQLQRWLEDADAAGTRAPNTKTLATADADGAPSARVVLLRGLDARGLTWYMNREPLKGLDFAGHPRATLVFHWELLQRLVRITGDVVRIAQEEAEAYFAGRPRRSQVAAMPSPQGRTIADRAALESATVELGTGFRDAVPLPSFWGGFRLRPRVSEFWQGRRDRMHDRFRYLRDEDVWRIERLAP